MTIMRIEAVTFGVVDLDACTRFFADAGLEPVETGAAGATFRTPEHQVIHLRMADDPALPHGRLRRQVGGERHEAPRLNDLGTGGPSPVPASLIHTTVTS